MNNVLPFQLISVESAMSLLNDRGHVLNLMNECGFFLCQRGFINVSLNDKTYQIQEGCAYYYMPSTYVSILKSSPDLEGIVVKCSLDFVMPLLQLLFDSGSYLTMRDNPCIQLTSEQRSTIENVTALLRSHLDEHNEELAQAQVPLSEIVYELKQAELAKRAEEAAANPEAQSDAPASSPADIIRKQVIKSLAQSLFFELMYAYTSNNAVTPKLNNSHDTTFQRFLTLLFRYYKQEREVSFYAKELSLSPRYFSSIVKESSGSSALQWIIQMVISATKEELASTDKSIKEISREFNFPSQSFFGKYFKQYVGMSPRKYRTEQWALRKVMRSYE